MAPSALPQRRKARAEGNTTGNRPTQPSDNVAIYLLLPLAMGFLWFLIQFLLTDDLEIFTIAYSFLIVLPFAAVAIALERRDVFGPLRIITYILILSSPIFSMYVYYIADGWKYEYALFWQPFSDLISGITLIAFAMGSLFVGYFIARQRMRVRVRTEPTRNYSRSNLRLVAQLSILVAIIAGYMFARDVNFTAALADNVMSRKGIHESTVGISVRGSALTHWRLLGISLPHGVMVAYCTLIWLKKINGTVFDFVLIGVLFAVSCFIPFIASSRTPILEVLVLLIMIRHYTVRSTNMPKLVVVGIIGLIVLGSLGELRRNPGELGVATLQSSLDQVIGSSYFVDLGKTSIVVNSVPRELDYLYGASLTTAAVAMIPRQLWPEKPIVRIGYFVGQEIIKLNNQTGIPPGLVAEMYMNFGYYGILPSFVLLGYLLYWLYRRLLTQCTFSTVVPYVVGVVIVSLPLLTADFTYGILQTLMYAAPIYFTVRLARSEVTVSH